MAVTAIPSSVMTTRTERLQTLPSVPKGQNHLWLRSTGLDPGILLLSSFFKIGRSESVVKFYSWKLKGSIAVDLEKAKILLVSSAGK